jgi:tRNA threonylcarbamoyladenosine biosynthesis protein TsaB
MIILTIRTDKPESEIGLYADQRQIAYHTWTAHRQLAETIHTTIDSVLSDAGHSVADIEAIVCFKGPGSFTGLRIGLTVGNTLGYIHQVPIVAAAGEHWQQEGIQKLLAGEHELIALPEYGAPAFTTHPKK